MPSRIAYFARATTGERSRRFPYYFGISSTRAKSVFVRR